MESENDHPYENGSNGPSTDASDTIQPGIAEGLYILTNKKTRTLLDLSGGMSLGSQSLSFSALPFGTGNTASRADIIGWERNTNHVIDHQLWALKQVDSNGSYRLMTFRGGTYLDLEGGCVIFQGRGGQHPDYSFALLRKFQHQETGGQFTGFRL